MLPEIDNLLRLQEADKEIRRLHDEIAEFPKRVAAIEHKLADTKAPTGKSSGRGQSRRSRAAQIRNCDNRHPQQDFQVPRPVSRRKNQRTIQSAAARNSVCGKGNRRYRRQDS
jgi:hypothetical protein